jgi:hypothetical protein
MLRQRRATREMLRSLASGSMSEIGRGTDMAARPPQHTTRYTQLSAAPFKDFWR